MIVLVQAPDKAWGLYQNNQRLDQKRLPWENPLQQPAGYASTYTTH